MVQRNLHQIFITSKCKVMSNETIIYSSSSIEQMLLPKKADILKMISETTFTKELAFAAQAINSNEKLRQADKNSILQAVFNVALTGLSLNPISKLASLTPRFINGTVQCLLMPQYQGLVKLITDTGSIKNIYAYNVFEGDEFEVILGSVPQILHKPKYISQNLTHSYCVAVLPDNTKQFEVMNKEELDYIKGLSDSYKAYLAGKIKSCIWVDFYGEMCRKTVVKRITKYLPKSEKWDKVNQAIDIDNSEYSASDDQISYCLRLIGNSTFDDDQKAEMETRAVNEGFTKNDATAMIEKLAPNQIQDKDRISMGMTYNQGDIKKSAKAYT